MSITLAVVPSTLPGDRFAALVELCDALSAILATDVHAKVPASYAELASELEKDRVHYAWMAPALVVLTSERLELKPLLTAMRGDRTDHCAALFVDDTSPARNVEALRGRTMAWVDRSSAAGYLVPRMHLSARGIDPEQLFGRELFLGSHAEVVRAVLEGRADAGATYAEQPGPGQPVRRAGYSDVAPDRPVRVLEWTRPIPNDLIVGHGLLSKAEHRAFGDAIMALVQRDNGRRLLYNAFHAERFVPTPRGALQPLWELVEDAREHGLLAQL